MRTNPRPLEVALIGLHLAEVALQDLEEIADNCIDQVEATPIDLVDFHGMRWALGQCVAVLETIALPMPGQIRHFGRALADLAGDADCWPASEKIAEAILSLCGDPQPCHVARAL
jgi:hypothetical protein